MGNYEEAYSCAPAEWGYGMRKLAVLGSTGSIGVSTLSIVRQFPDRFQAVALAAGKNLVKLKEQVLQFRPTIVSVASTDDARDLRAQLPDFRGEILCGAEGLLAVATHPDTQMVGAALVGGDRGPLLALVWLQVERSELVHAHDHDRVAGAREDLPSAMS